MPFFNLQALGVEGKSVPQRRFNWDWNPLDNFPEGIEGTARCTSPVSGVLAIPGNSKPRALDDSTNVIYSLLQLTIHIRNNVIKLIASAHFATGCIDANNSALEVFCLPGHKPFDQTLLVLCHNEYRNTIRNQLPNGLCTLYVDSQNHVLASVQGLLNLQSQARKGPNRVSKRR